MSEQGWQPMEPAIELAERIARDLFTNGRGQRADRLVLMIDSPQKYDLGGWCFEAVVNRIYAVLNPPVAEGFHE